MAASLLLLLASITYMESAVSGMECTKYKSFPHPLDCTKYYFCDRGYNPNLFVCPGGLHFNPDKANCDWPENVNCTMDSVENVPEKNGTEEDNQHSLVYKINERMLDLVFPLDKNISDVPEESSNPQPSTTTKQTEEQNTDTTNIQENHEIRFGNDDESKKSKDVLVIKEQPEVETKLKGYKRSTSEVKETTQKYTTIVNKETLTKERN